MIILIIWGICIVLGIIIGFNIDSYVSTWTKIGYSILGLLGGIVGGVLIAGMITLFIGNFFETDNITTIKYELLSFGDGEKSDGDFFLGCGNIDEKMVYYYYRYDTTDSKAIVRRRISADISKIYEDDITKPYILVKIKDTDVKSGRGYWVPLSRNEGWQRYEIHLPKGSVIRQYKLDN